MSGRMKDLGKPIRLPLSIAAQVAWKSIKVRLSRSLVTVSSVILAVAFLLVVMGDDITSGAVYANLREQTRPQRAVDQLQRSLTRRRSDQVMLSLYRDHEPAIRSWAGSLGHELASPRHEVLVDLLALRDWITDLRPSQQFVLVRTHSIFDHLLSLEATPMPSPGAIDAGSPSSIDGFIEAAGAIKGVLLPVDRPRLVSLAAASASLRSLRDGLRAAEASRLELVKTHQGREAILARLAAGEDPDVLASAGLPYDQIDDPDPRQVLPGIVAHLRLQQDVGSLQRILMTPRVCTDATGATVPAKVMSVDDFIDVGLLAHPCATAIQAEIDASLGTRQVEVTRTLLEQRRLSALEETFKSKGYDPTRSGQRTFWLIVLSFIVCVVGIVNSMMMAVTERFREIATMKCLGAVDGFILQSFLIESGSIGSVGAAIGSLLGLIITVLQASGSFGGYFWSAFPVGEMLLAMLIALICGMVLTILGALLPAYRAARMHPIEAMRLEG